MRPTAKGDPDQRWYLCRIDDNGNRFVVARLATRQDADALASVFEARGHKQTYCVADEP